MVVNDFELKGVYKMKEFILMSHVIMTYIRKSIHLKDSSQIPLSC